MDIWVPSYWGTCWPWWWWSGSNCDNGHQMKSAICLDKSRLTTIRDTHCHTAQCDTIHWITNISLNQVKRVLLFRFHQAANFIIKLKYISVSFVSAGLKIILNLVLAGPEFLRDNIVFWSRRLHVKLNLYHLDIDRISLSRSRPGRKFLWSGFTI